MLTLEGFPFITMNTKEYHSECSGNYHRIMRRILVTACELDGVQQIGGWSGLPPFQYQRSRNEKADRNVLISVRNETNFYREKSEWLGWVVPCITGSMMTCLQYQNHLCDYR
ncbi:hypothetical protein Tco_0255137 [Tanacetum coccineum]